MKWTQVTSCANSPSWCRWRLLSHLGLGANSVVDTIPPMCTYSDTVTNGVMTNQQLNYYFQRFSLVIFECNYLLSKHSNEVTFPMFVIMSFVLVAEGVTKRCWTCFLHKMRLYYQEGNKSYLNYV